MRLILRPLFWFALIAAAMTSALHGAAVRVKDALAARLGLGYYERVGLKPPKRCR